MSRTINEESTIKRWFVSLFFAAFAGIREEVNVDLVFDITASQVPQK